MAGYTTLMFTSGRGVIEAMVGATRRAWAFSGLEDVDSYYWLLDNPDVQRFSHLANDTIPALLPDRILPHQTLSAVCSVPVQQQIDFETPSQILGIAGLVISATVIFNIAYRIRELSLPVPDYNSTDFYPTLLVGDSISIAFTSQRMVSGRMGGYTLSGSTFLWKASHTFGISVEGAGTSPRTDDLRIRFSDRFHVHEDTLISGLRRFETPFDSFTGFTPTRQVAHRGLGFSLTCPLQEAVLFATDTFLSAPRIPSQVSSWTLIESVRIPIF